MKTVFSTATTIDIFSENIFEKTYLVNLANEWNWSKGIILPRYEGESGFSKHWRDAAYNVDLVAIRIQAKNYENS